MPRKRSIIKNIIFVMIALVVTTTLALGSFVFISEKRLQTKLSRMKAGGSFPTLAQLIGPKVPDDQNGAVIYRQAFRILDQPDVRKDMYTIGDFLSVRHKTKSPKQWKDTRLAVRRQTKLISTIEQAQMKPKCQFEVAADYQHTDYSRWTRLRDLARLLSANVIITARDGKMDECTESICLGYKIVTTTGNDPFLISELMKDALVRIVSYSMRDAARYNVFDEKHALSIYDVLTNIDLDHSYERMLGCESGIYLETFRKCREKPEAFEEVMDLTDWGNSSPSSKYEKILFTHTWRPFLASTDTSIYLSHVQRLKTAAGLPFWKAESQGLLIAEDNIPSYAVVTKFMLPVYLRAYNASQSSMAEVDGSRIFLALQAYKSRFGSYPSTLKELRSKLGWQIPKDRFSGKDFIYKKQGQGFLLYSIGLDQKDDKGKPTPGGSDPGDIVWKLDK